MIWAKKFLKKVRPFWNKNSKFQKSVMKIKPEHEQNSKISVGGWLAQKIWFFVKVTFLAPVIFWSMRSWKLYQKMTGAKKVSLMKNQFCHAYQPHKIWIFVHALALFSWLNSETLRGSCQIVLHRRPIFFRPKLVLLFMSTSSLMQ